MTRVKPSVYSVSQVNSYIRQMFASDLVLTRLSIRGEISNCRYHSSGHIYFSLKDEGGQIRCVMFASSRRNLKFRLEDGQKVVAGGSVSVYEKSGEYQLYVTGVQPDGVGALYEQYERLKKRLSEMGMFNAMYKQPIPRYIHTLGVVTAPTGAAVRDIINVSKRRNPGIQIILYPALVQGDGAAESIVRGIRMLDAYGVDTIIVGRGGGSIEDLWAFNEEIVAQAIFDCRTPLISAVGHETDTTIADFAADLRAPTPSAAAELAVDDMVMVKDTLALRGQRLRALMGEKTDRSRSQAESYRLKLRLNGPEARIQEAMQDLDHIRETWRILMDRRLSEARERLRAYPSRLTPGRRLEVEKIRLRQTHVLIGHAMAEKLKSAKHHLQLLDAKLSALSPEMGLERGYAYIESEDGRAVTSVQDVSGDQVLRVTMKDGSLRAQVLEKKWKQVP